MPVILKGDDKSFKTCDLKTHWLIPYDLPLIPYGSKGIFGFPFTSMINFRTEFSYRRENDILLVI